LKSFQRISSLSFSCLVGALNLKFFLPTLTVRICPVQEEKGNIAADALSRCQEEGTLATITIMIPDWYQEVKGSYGMDE